MKRRTHKMKTRRRIVSLAAAFIMLLTPVLALADFDPNNVDISQGSVTVDSTKTTQDQTGGKVSGEHGGAKVTITDSTNESGTSTTTSNTVTINTGSTSDSSVGTVDVKVENVNFAPAAGTAPAVSVSGEGTANLELNNVDVAVSGTAGSAAPGISIAGEGTSNLKLSDVDVTGSGAPAISKAGAGTANLDLNDVDVTLSGAPAISLNGGKTNIAAKDVNITVTGNTAAMDVTEADALIDANGANNITSDTTGLVISVGSVTVTGDTAGDTLTVVSTGSNHNAINSDGVGGTLTVTGSAEVKAVNRSETNSPINGDITVNGVSTTSLNAGGSGSTTTVSAQRSSTQSEHRISSTGSGGSDIPDLNLSSDPDKTVELPITLQPSDRLTANGIRIEPILNSNSKPLVSAGMLISAANAEMLADAARLGKENFLVNSKSLFCFASGDGSDAIELNSGDPSTWPEDLFAAAGSGVKQKPTQKQQALVDDIRAKKKWDSSEFNFEIFTNRLMELYSEASSSQGQSFDQLAFESELVKSFNVTLEGLQRAWGDDDVIAFLKARYEEQGAVKNQAISRVLPINQEGAEQLSGEEFTFALNGRTVARAKIGMSYDVTP